MDELSFDGRVAVVTGAGRGIGRAHAVLLASRGAAVVVNDLGGAGDGTGADRQPADEVVSEIVSAGGLAVANHASVSDEEGARSIIQSALDSFGRIDILVNNAGIYDPIPFAELTVERFRRQLDVNALGSIMTTMAVWPHMVSAGYGRIVHTGSGSTYGDLHATDYGASKAAVLGFTLNLANEAAAHGIGVNCVFPGANTRLGHAGTRNHAIDPDELLPARPELVSSAVLYLAHESCGLNGEVLTARLGRVARIGTFESTGYTNADISAEDVATHIEQILELNGASLFPLPATVTWNRERIKQLLVER